MVSAIQRVRGKRQACVQDITWRQEKERAAKNAARLTETSESGQTTEQTAFRFVRSATNKTVSNANIGKFLAGSETSKHFLGGPNGETPTQAAFNRKTKYVSTLQNFKLKVLYAEPRKTRSCRGESRNSAFVFSCISVLDVMSWKSHS